MPRWENDKTNGLKTLFCVHFAGKALKCGVPSAKMTKRSDLGLKTLFSTNSCTLLKKVAKKLYAQCENDKTCWSSGWKRCFVQTRALCWKSLKGGVPSAKMTKRSDLGLKTLFRTNSCTLLKSAKKLYAQCENEKTCWSWAENAVLYKLVHFAESR